MNRDTGSRPKFRERISARLESFVTFTGRRSAPRSDALPAQALGIASTSGALQQPRFRSWLPAAMALFMTALTAGVLWAVLSQVPTVLSDTKTLTAQIAGLESKIHPDSQTAAEKEESEAAIQELHKQENKVAQEKARVNTRVAALRDKQQEMEEREREIATQQQAENEKLEKHKQTLKELLGRDIQVDPGPPVRYDAGEAPKEPWYGGTLAYRVFSRSYYRKWNAWKKAQTACKAFNTFQDATGMELIQLQGQAQSIKSQLDQLNQTLAKLDARADEFRNQLEQYTSAPWKLWEDLDAKRRQLANTAAVRMAFWCFDIPTLLSCLLTTAIAYSRMLLIAGRLGTRQLARNPS